MVNETASRLTPKSYTKLTYVNQVLTDRTSTPYLRYDIESREIDIRRKP
jgi:hypothetical protein